MFGWFRRNKEVEELKEETKNSFKSVKEDVDSISKWLKHLNSSDDKLKIAISEINERLSTMENDIAGVKNMVDFLNQGLEKVESKQVFKTPRAVYGKQRAVEAVEAVQTPVQTAVQTGKFYDLQTLSVMERAIVWILLNTELRLSYDDLAAMTGKDRSTIRGQINAIKQKSEGLIKEVMEKNGKKRVFIPEEMKEKLLKNVKVRVSEGQRDEKKQKR